MDLTKQRAIIEHRRMWNWIAEHGWEVYQLLNNKHKTLGIIKRFYLELNHDKVIVSKPHFSCFCCEYVKRNLENPEILDCSKCPLDWGNGKTCNNDYNSLFSRLCLKIEDLTITEDEFKSLALQIANLPERK